MHNIGDWKYIGIVIGVSIVINLSLPIWLWLARIFDDKNSCRNTKSQARDSDVSEFDDNYTEGGRQMSESSVVSNAQYSTISSSVTSQLTAILEARPRRTAGHRGDRKRRRHERDIIYTAETFKLNFEESPCEEHTEILIGESSGAKSVMSRLSVDDVSMIDTIDENHGGTSIYNKTDISYETGCWIKLLEVSEWEPALASLTGFYMTQGIIENISELAEVALISHMIGTAEANVFMMTRFLIEMTDVIAVGYQEAIGVLVPQADGSGNDLMVGRYLQIAIGSSIIFQIPGFVLWSFYMHDTILWFNFDEQTAAIAQNYTYSIFIYFVADSINECLLEFLDVTDHEKYVTIFAVIQACTQAGVIFLMASLGISNMVAIGLAQGLAKVTLLFANIIFVANQGWFDHISEGLIKTLGFKDLRAMWTTFTTAIPLSVAWILSYGEWQVMIIFAQSIGPDEVAAWNILGYIWDFFESVTEAVASAAEVRVGFRMGAGKPQLAKKMSEKSIYLGTLFAVYTAGGLFVLSEFLPSWLTPNLIYQKLVFDQIPLIGFGGILMVPGLVMESILCAQGRVRLMTAIEVIVSWFIAIPVAAVLVYYFDFSLEGMITGLVVGYSTGATILCFFIVRSNWEELSKSVIEQNGAEGARYLDTDWDDLSPEVKTAAATLGYTKILWESDREPKSTEKAWNTLTKVEKKAASVLGYNKKKWNGENDNEDGYEEYDFDDLPTDVRKAAKFLGFNRSIWDKDGKIPIEKKDWAELTEAQKDAASTLGYTEDKWNDDSGSSSSSSSSSSEGSAIQLDKTMTSIPEDKEVNYDNCDYRKLPEEVLKAAKLLGYTRSSWDNNRKIPIESKDWSELTETEQKAASTLGYTKEKWDNESDSSSSSAESEVAPQAQAVDYDHCDFRKLPERVQKAAKILGYTRSIWDNNGKVPIESKDWSKLTKIEQKAASTLGYTEEKWDNESDCSSSSVESVVAPQEQTIDYDDCDFRKLPEEAQKAAKVLGYTHSIWDKDGKVPIESKDWSELTEREQKAASTLGYTEERWDNESDCSSSSVESVVAPQEQTIDYDDCDFRKLPEEAQKAAKVLGYTRSIWDKDGKVPIESKDWSELTEREQKAASTLGYTEEKWDNDSDSDSLSSNDPKTRQQTNEKTEGNDDCDFRELPGKLQKGAKLLGEIQIKSKTWSHLTKDEQDAAFKLGYTKEKWNSDFVSKSPPSDCMSWNTLFGTQDGIGLSASMDAISNSICSLNPSTSWGERQSFDSSTEIDESATR